MKQLFLFLILVLGSITAAQASAPPIFLGGTPANQVPTTHLAYYVGPWCGNQPCSYYRYRYYYYPSYTYCRWYRVCGYYGCGWVRRCW